ncbi:hypothetical protein OXX79_001136 [Metschnikowia pulcherrima]
MEVSFTVFPQSGVSPTLAAAVPPQVKATVASESLSAFNDLKLSKRSKFIIFALSPEKSPIVVDKTSSDDDSQSFLAELRGYRCKCAVYDFEYEIGGGEGKKTEIVHYTWSPNTAPACPKIVYASSKDALRRALNGFTADIQGMDIFEVAYDPVLERVSRGAGSH